ncbi:uncharacterized protein LOC133114387 isoform X2 [Conger conger]|uniref:uncharacterized protein LOC133114387 isoform X2 n=1 Tax=Conger conger TaxID=82655 RepID=UPI002A59BF4C|nr:uncharacterized protein LOC133114387 isoform X2 [Conger conger]
MPSTSEMEELKMIEEEMNEVMLQRRQLSDRQALLAMLQELRKTKRVQHMQESEEPKRSLEIEEIQKQLVMLTEKAVELQERKNKVQSQPDPVFVQPVIAPQSPKPVLKMPTVPRMPSTSEMQELERIEVEMNKVVLQRRQLCDRRAMLTMLEEFRKQSSNIPHMPHPEAKKSPEIQEIQKQLAMLSAKEMELQGQKDVVLYSQNQPDVFLDNDGTDGVSPVGKLFIVPPPSKPAPQVILEVKDLPNTPSLTQCPACYEFIITETVSRVGSTTWMVCFMSTLLGCVAGCCLIPFCTKRFKDVEHKCPKCRNKIHTNTKL